MTACRSGRAYYPVFTTLISGVNIPPNQGYRPKIDPHLLEVLSKSVKTITNIEVIKNEITQTMYRESPAQTEPYTPEVMPTDDIGLQILTLGWLSWQNGLPAGMREAVAIERARQRRAWERAIPLPVDSRAAMVRDMILEAIEENEWAHREAELQAISAIRLELAEMCSKENISSIKIKFEKRMLRFTTVKKAQKDSAIKKMRWELSRNVRKMVYKNTNTERKYKRWDVIKELSDKTSELYGPQERFGVNPRRLHEVIPAEFHYWNTFTNMDVVKQYPKMFDVKQTVKFDYIKKSKPVVHKKELCVRETKWTEQYLDKLHTLLKGFRRHRARTVETQKLKLKQLITRSEMLSEMPRVREKSAEDEELFQACLFLQKTVKGRAIQTVMFEGRFRCQELIEELKSTHALQSNIEDKSMTSINKEHMRQREKEIKNLEAMRRMEIFASLEGKTVSEVLDFLAKELLRLQNERVTHALALLANRERHRREAEEAGRRQAEEQRRREHEEMWKQIAKVYQNSVDMIHEDYAEEIIAKICAKDARMAAEEYAKRIDKAAQEAETRKTCFLTEELVADLVHNFALPEVEKQMVRKRLAERQKTVLSACHDEIYSKIEKLCHGPRTSSGLLKPLMRPHKHRVPRTSYVKFLKLKRLGTSGSNSPEGSTDQQKSEIFEYWSTGYSPGDVVLDADQNNV